MEQPHIINDQNKSLEPAKVAEPALCFKHPTEMINFNFLPKFVGKLQRCILKCFFFLRKYHSAKITDGENDRANELCLVKRV